MSQANKFNCKRDSKGNFVKTKIHQWKQNVLEGIRKRKLKHSQTNQDTPTCEPCPQVVCETQDVPAARSSIIDPDPGFAAEQHTALSMLKHDHTYGGYS